VTGDTSGSGWLKKLAKRFKGRAAHDTLPTLVTLTRGAAFHNPVEGAGETAKLLVNMEMQAAANTDGDGAAVKSSGWLDDFLLDGNGKANPNKGLKIVL
jgi:hypothetical protein